MSKCFLKCLTFCLFPLLARIAECLEIKTVSAVKWISLSIKFVVCIDDEKETLGKPYLALPQASHGNNKTACDDIEGRSTADGPNNPARMTYYTVV